MGGLISCEDGQELKVESPRPFRRDLKVKGVEELLGGILVFTAQTTYGEPSIEHYTGYDAEVRLVYCSCPGYEAVSAALASERGIRQRC